MVSSTRVDDDHHQERPGRFHPAPWTWKKAGWGWREPESRSPEKFIQEADAQENGSKQRQAEEYFFLPIFEVQDPGSGKDSPLRQRK